MFNTTFFSERLEEEDTVEQKGEDAGVAAAALGVGVAASLLIKGAEKVAAKEPVDKRGGDRYA